MNLTIRPATQEDIPAVLSFIRELAEYERLAHEVQATEEILRESLFGSRPCAEVVFACLGAQPVAFAVFFHNFSTFLGCHGLFLEDLYVKPAFRRRGVARTLLRHLAQIARERGCGRFEWAVLNWNKPAIQFYESLGAVGLNEWTIYRVAGRSLERLAGMTQVRKARKRMAKKTPATS